MRAAYIERFGGPEVLTYGHRPDPEPGPRDVVVRVGACGLCRHDILTRAGAFPDISLPVILGHQIAGIVEAVGSDVIGLAPGESVMSMVYQTCDRCDECLRGRQTLCRERPQFLGEDIDGGYAELVVAAESVWIRLPDALTAEEGAVLTCTAGTAFHAITSRGQARVGETALVTGASGGVGIQALRILKAVGLRTIAVTRGEHHVDSLQRAGADEVIVTRDGAFRTASKELTDGGVDLAIDIVGGAGLTETIHSVRPGGRIVILGNVEGGTVELRPAHLILKEISLIGTKSITREEMGRLLGLVARGILRPEVGARWSLAEAAAAHASMESSGSGARPVLIPE